MPTLHNAYRYSTLGNEKFDVERKELQQEIQSLRQSSSRIKELEEENKILQSRVDANDEVSLGVGCTFNPEKKNRSYFTSPEHDEEHADKIKLASKFDNRKDGQSQLSEVKKVRRECENLKRALVLLQEKYRISKDLRKQWESYFAGTDVSKRQKSTIISRDSSRDVLELNKSRSQSPRGPLTPTTRPTYDAHKFTSPLVPVQVVDQVLTAQSQQPVSQGCQIQILDDKTIAAGHDLHEDAPASTANILTQTTDISPRFHQTKLSSDILLNSKSPQDIQLPPSLSAFHDSDTPILVSERSLKRKRPAPTKLETSRPINDTGNFGSGSSTKPVRIKSDPGSSSPMAIFPHQCFVTPHDSIDLDEVGDKRQTPHKRRQLENKMRSRASLDDVLETEDPGDFTNPISSLEDGNAESVSLVQDEDFSIKNDQNWHSRFESDISPWLSEKKHPKASRHYRRTSKACKSRSHPEQVHSSSGQYLISRGSLRDSPKMLRPTDPNRHVLPRTSRDAVNNKRTIPWSRRDHGAASVPSIAEDGEEATTANKKSTLQDGKLTPRSKCIDSSEVSSGFKAPRNLGMHQRLECLLSEPYHPQRDLTTVSSAIFRKPTTPVKTPLNVSLPGSDPKIRSTPITSSGESSVTRTMGSRLTRSSSKSSVKATPLAPLPAQNKPNQALRKHEPLRVLPVSSLCPSDFKLNPMHNHGLDYAYSEVVRNREARKCMPGCTRPGCCGLTLRKAVEMGGYTVPRRSLLSRSTSDDDDRVSREEQALLEEYLGDDHVRLEGMSEGERQELVLAAKTEQLANRHGKHRRTYGRAVTPPGFWEADMPTTQEAREHRAAAKELERLKVEEMYREAMRPEGRYRFRDE